MENLQQYNDEIDLKQLWKRVVKGLQTNKKLFTIFLFVIMGFSAAYFISVVLNPNYKSEQILKSKAIKYDQVEKIVEKINSYIEDSSLNKLDSTSAQYINNSGLYFITISENEVDVKDKTELFRLYTMNLFYNKLPSDKTIQDISIIIRTIQGYCSKDNEVEEEQIKLNNSIHELDSLIHLAYDVGNQYKENMRSTGSGQIMIMNDMYKGINDLTNQKLNFQMEFSLLDSHNIIFDSSPVVVSKKIERPYLIFLIGFFLWVLIVSAWIVFDIIFGDN